MGPNLRGLSPYWCEMMAHYREWRARGWSCPVWMYHGNRLTMIGRPPNAMAAPGNDNRRHA